MLRILTQESMKPMVKEETFENSKRNNEFYFLEPNTEYWVG